MHAARRVREALRDDPADAAGLVELPFGRSRLLVGRHPRSSVIRRVDAPALVDAAGEVRAALRNPDGCSSLRDLSREAHKIAVSVCDKTRPQPRELILRALLQELSGADADLTVLIATGSHQGATRAELREMVGEHILSNYKVVNHDAREPSTLTFFGMTEHHVPVWLNRIWVEADLRITAGVVEPHFFAGFSGGPKMVAPGLAGMETILTLHDAHRIGDSRATWGVTEDNPVHRDIRDCAALAPPHLALEVLIDRDKRLTHVFAGELFRTHAKAQNAARQFAMAAVDHEYEVVVTTNSGYPLDRDLYQSVKGMAAAERIVRPGGVIVIAAECADGLPDRGAFGELLLGSRSLNELRARIEQSTTLPDQWQAQILLRVLARAQVEIFSSGLTRAQLSSAHLAAIDDVEEAVNQAMAEAGPDARVCYLPEGPQTIPYLSEQMALEPT
jgi:lactate racemase